MHFITEEVKCVKGLDEETVYIKWDAVNIVCGAGC